MKQAPHLNALTPNVKVDYGNIKQGLSYIPRLVFKINLVNITEALVSCKVLHVLKITIFYNKHP